MNWDTQLAVRTAFTALLVERPSWGTKSDRFLAPYIADHAARNQGYTIARDTVRRHLSNVRRGPAPPSQKAIAKHWSRLKGTQDDFARLYATDFERGAELGASIAGKLWRSGWRGATIHEDQHHAGFVAGFTKALAQLWRDV